MRMSRNWSKRERCNCATRISRISTNSGKRSSVWTTIDCSLNEASVRNILMLDHILKFVSIREIRVSPSELLRLRRSLKSTSAVILYFALGMIAAADTASLQPLDHHGAQARQVMEHVQKIFWDPAKGIYTKTAQDRTPDYVWREAVA